MPDPSHDHAAARPGGCSIPFGRRGLILGAMALIGAGLWLNWGWVAAIGAAPPILALAPCAVMCGLGLCMKGGSKRCAAAKSSDTGPKTARVDPRPTRKRNPMKLNKAYTMAAVLGLGIATSAALAQGDTPAMPEGSMQGMMGGDMSGMQGMMGMMGMMRQMGPMMEHCTGMMQQTAHHQPGHPDGATPPAGQDATPAPQGG